MRPINPFEKHIDDLEPRFRNFVRDTFRDEIWIAKEVVSVYEGRGVSQRAII